MKNREVVELLLKNGLTVSSAESVTGGLFAKCVTDIPGASGCFPGSFVTYSDREKAAMLGVSRETLARRGAISAETAEEMAEGLFRATGCDVCISVTGNAGPEPAEGKPVGESYIGLRIDGETRVIRFRSEKTERAPIRQETCEKMFELILAELAARGFLPE